MPTGDDFFEHLPYPGNQLPSGSGGGGFFEYLPYPGNQLPSGAGGGGFFESIFGSVTNRLGTLLGTMSPPDVGSAFSDRLGRGYGWGDDGGAQATPLSAWRDRIRSQPATGFPTPPQQGQASQGGQSNPGISGQVGRPSTTSTRIAQKIMQTASSLGLDPNFALWVAENEGGLDDAAANRRNLQGSQAYGPYQLLLGGGLGDEALRQGIDPRNAASVDRQIEFALKHAAQNGWGAWEAVTARGIDPWTGTSRRPGGLASPVTAPSQPRQTPTPQVQPTPQGGGYGTYATLSPDEYVTAFDFNQAYTNPFNAAIPRHRGVDLTVKGAGNNNGRGSRVGAFHPGRVAEVTIDPNGGNGVIIQGDDGLYHRYFHFDNILVKKGDVVGRGTPIGILGASGTEGFPHLHYEVSRGVNGDPMDQLIDPRPYLAGAR